MITKVIIVLLAISIICHSSVTINNTQIAFNIFSIIALILYLIEKGII